MLAAALDLCRCRRHPAQSEGVRRRAFAARHRRRATLPVRVAGLVHMTGTISGTEVPGMVESNYGSRTLYCQLDSRIHFV